MRELVDLLLREARALPALDPRPGLDVGHAVLALTVASQVLARLARVLAGQLDLEHAVDTQGFFLETLDGVGDFLGGGAGEVVDLAWRGGVSCFVLFVEVGFLVCFLTLVGCSGAVPEEGPLQGLATLEFVLEAEGVVLVGELEEVCKERLES